MNDDKSNWSFLPQAGLLTAALAFLVGLTSGFRSDRKAEPAKTQETASVPELAIERPSHRPGSCRDFLAEQGVLVRAPGSNKAMSPPRLADERGVRLIVSLPDAIDSQFGYRYDNCLDAIGRVMADSQFIFEAHWLPWQVVGGDRKAGSPKYLGNPATEPGALIYRQRSHARQHVIIFLVGENPLGIKTVPLRDAVDLASLWEDRLTIVGPFFSGSQVSLGRTLADWRDDHGWEQKFRLISGTTLGLRRWGEVSRDLGERLARGFPAEKCSSGWPVPEVECMQVPLPTLNKAVLHYLARPGETTATDLVALGRHKALARPAGLVAYLVETDSGFGSSVGAAPDARSSVGDGSLIYRFPMHIGRLSGILAREQRERDERLGFQPRGGYALRRLDEERAGGDAIPAADETRTARLNQRLLTDYWASIRREQVRHVGIVATDPRDRLFLLEQIRRECPDVRPFGFGADLHLNHPDYRHFTRGFVIAGTYPLVPQSLSWVPVASQNRRAPFTSSSAQGLYNAMQSALGRIDNLFDYYPPSFRDYPRTGKPPVWISTVGENGDNVPLAYFSDYADEPLVFKASTDLVPPFAPPAPVQPVQRYLALLVAAAIGYGAWLVFRSFAHGPHPVGGGCTESIRHDVMTKNAMLIATGVLFAILPFAGTLIALSELRSEADDTFLDESWQWNRVLIGLVVGGAIGIVAIVGRLLYRPMAEQWRAELEWAGRVDPKRIGLSLAGLAIFLLILDPIAQALGVGYPLLVVVLPVVLVAGWPPLRHRLYSLSVHSWVTFITSAVAIATLWWAASSWHHAGIPGRWLFAERALAFGSGCSAAVPAAVMAMGIFGYGVIGLLLARKATRFRVPVPVPERVKAGPGGLKTGRIKMLDRAVRVIAEEDHAAAQIIVNPFSVFVMRTPRRQGGRYRWRASVWATFIAIATVCVLVRLRAQPTWETRGFDRLFVTGFLALGFLTFLSSFRVLLLWKSVEQMMRAVISIPMVWAYDRAPHKVSRVFGAYLLAARRRSLDLAIPRHLAEKLRTKLSEDAAGGGDMTAALASAELEQWWQKNPSPSVTRHDFGPRESIWLSGLSALLFKHVSAGWGSRPLPEAFGSVTEAGKDNAEPQSWREQAEMLIAIQVVIYLSQFLVQLRYLAGAAGLTAACLLLAVTAYQFEPERLIMNTAAAAAVVVAGLLIWVLFRINRNELVSRVCRTTPNRFSLDSAFVQNFVAFVLPLLLVISVQMAGRMRGIAEPILEWVR